MAGSFFTTPDGVWFQPTEPCRGPWDPSACHAGPPTGLMARAAERAVPGQRLVRLTVDLIRPIPHAGFSIETVVLRGGRSVSTTEMTIVNGDGKPVVTARGMHLAVTDVGSVATAAYDTPRLEDATPGRFPAPSGGHGLTAFDSGVEAMFPPGQFPTPGPTVMWMRALPLLPNEPGSGFQRICPLADCGNAVSRNADPEGLSFVNTDLTIMLHREPVGHWFGTDAVSRWEPTGAGISDSTLFDEQGPAGKAMQTILLQRTF
jgi:hypothetical protein